MSATPAPHARAFAASARLVTRFTSKSASSRRSVSIPEAITGWATTSSTLGVAIARYYIRSSASAGDPRPTFTLGSSASRAQPREEVGG